MSKTNASNKLQKLLIYFGVFVLVIAIGLNMYNKNTEKRAIENATTLVSQAFSASAEHPEKSNRIIVEKYLRNERELLDTTKEALPLLTPIGDYEVVELLSVRAYYGENKDNPQFYDIKFKDIKRIRWEIIQNFDDFLNEINRL